MMKIESVRIVGMHNVEDKKYNLSNFNYLYGPNGAGKSTVMQAIQLALLGYIPGTKKLTSEIFKHSNPSKSTMSVTVELVDTKTSERITIERSWVNTGKSIVANIVTSPEDLNIDSLLGELKLPILDFSEFKNMTSNKLKDWFINFLPPTAKSANIKNTLIDATSDLSLSENCIEERGDMVDQLSNIYDLSESPIAGIRNINDHVKQAVSFKKDELSRIQSTIQSLVHYDDTEISSSEIPDLQKSINEIDVEIGKLNELKPAITTYQRHKQMYEEFIANIKYNVPEYDDITQNPIYIETKAHASELNSKIADISSKKQLLNDKLSELIRESNDLNRLMSNAGNGLCPYIGTECDSVKSAITKWEQRDAIVQSEMVDIQSNISEIESKIDGLIEEFHDAEFTLNKISTEYSNFYSMKQGVRLDVSDDIKSGSIEEINKHISELTVNKAAVSDMLVKALANQKYEELYTKLSSDAAMISEMIRVLNTWVKLTDVNGLQTELMKAPFRDLANTMTKYLQIFFHNNQISAEFNLSTKANSFNFGMIINGSYLDFDLLSSGEKCLYIISLLTALIKSESPTLPMILIDDLLDHVDYDKAQTLFNTLYELTDVQIVLAGVQICEHPDKDNFIIKIGV